MRAGPYRCLFLLDLVEHEDLLGLKLVQTSLLVLLAPNECLILFRLLGSFEQERLALLLQMPVKIGFGAEVVIEDLFCRLEHWLGLEIGVVARCTVSRVAARRVRSCAFW